MYDWLNHSRRLVLAISYIFRRQWYIWMSGFGNDEEFLSTSKTWNGLIWSEWNVMLSWAPIISWEKGNSMQSMFSSIPFNNFNLNLFTHCTKNKNKNRKNTHTMTTTKALVAVPCLHSLNLTNSVQMPTCNMVV